MRLSNKGLKELQKGAVIVEFAIVVPLLLLLVIGICEFGYGFYHLNILNKSAQDGARFFSNTEIARFDSTVNKASLSYPINVGSTNSENITYMQNLVIYGNINGTGNALMPPNNGSGYSFPTTPVNFILAVPTAAPDHIQLTVQYTHHFILGTAVSNFIPRLGSTGSIILTASSVLRVE